MDFAAAAVLSYHGEIPQGDEIRITLAGTAFLTSSYASAGAT